MKKKILVLLGLAVVLVVVVLIFVSCKDATTAETSDAAATVAESTGAATTVAEATDVVAGDEGACADCHNDTTVIFSKETQYSNSVHGTGLNFERNDAGCAVCHTSEGFTARVAASATLEVAADAPAIQNASPVNCRTCHDIHTTYTEADWALKTVAPVTLEFTGDVFDKGEGNLCAKCHQPRPGTDIPVAGGPDVEITSTRYGPHHGPQSSMLLGVGSFGEYKGSSVHYDATENGCIDCHMTDSAYGKQAGGHTWKMAYEYHEAEREFLTGCLKCHEDIESFDRNDVETELAVMVEELRVLLVKQGLITDEGSGIAGTFTAEQAGALWNYKTFTEDRSNGLHNPGFGKFLLKTGIDALKG